MLLARVGFHIQHECVCVYARVYAHGVSVYCECVCMVFLCVETECAYERCVCAKCACVCSVCVCVQEPIMLRYMIRKHLARYSSHR